MVIKGNAAMTNMATLRVWRTDTRKNRINTGYEVNNWIMYETLALLTH